MHPGRTERQGTGGLYVEEIGALKGINIRRRRARLLSPEPPASARWSRTQERIANRAREARAGRGRATDRAGGRRAREGRARSREAVKCVRVWRNILCHRCATTAGQVDIAYDDGLIKFLKTRLLSIRLTCPG